MEKIAVIGAGTMGSGIAHVFAQHGHSVRLADVSGQALDKAMITIRRNLERQKAREVITPEMEEQTLSRISCDTRLQNAVEEAALVVEAATENEAVKLKLFGELDRQAPAAAILASNTSSISITRIASVTQRPARVIGMHFMNPVPLMKLVEIINGYATAPDVTATVRRLAEQLGKTACVVQDYPGFIANRILMPMLNEAIRALWEGVAGVEEIDTIMKLGMAHPMGPLQLADFIGLDVCLSILRVLDEGLDRPGYAPCPLLVNMVNAGKLGVKSGEGFYSYTPGSREGKVSERFLRSP
jgi:3-hydroxybutyryl-CoA dehydrogenase